MVVTRVNLTASGPVGFPKKELPVAGAAVSLYSSICPVAKDRTGLPLSPHCNPLVTS
ncbi:hypothetical protein [Gudongella oleilytica]|uniref:hypothetical protein n=1 Tax=Gudongella oleilytica TaxID=1582259 RepID=UPI0013E8D133|nr:hypothetical protein [Gudongella oleilytica]